MKLAITQPYFFPYLGYFQLINAVDKFVFYDDVNFMKNGWINRNRIIINKAPHYFTVQLKGASSNKLINEVEFRDNRPKLKKTIQVTYKRAPFFEDVWHVIEECLNFETEYIGELASFSVKRVCQYLGIKTIFEDSSKSYSGTKGLGKNERLYEICKINNAATYINPPGGKKLYKKDDFKKENIELLFLKPKFTKYRQFSDEFIPRMSIIDVMMFNSVEKIKEMLDNYELI